MMYKCDDCGCVFDEPQTWKEDRGECHGSSSYETVAGCPECGGTFEKAYYCKECDEYYTGAEKLVFDGICEECLEKEITADNFFNFCEANKKENILEDFVMLMIFNMDTVKHPSIEFHEMVVEVYKDKSKFDSDLDLDIKSFMLDKSDICEMFAEYLNKKEVR